MNRYLPLAAEYHELYEAFKESGFTDEQAWELMTCYCRQSVVDNILASQIRTTNSKRRALDNLKRINEERRARMEKEKETRNEND